MRVSAGDAALLLYCLTVWVLMFFGIGYGLFIRKRHPHIAEELREQREERERYHWHDKDVDLDEWERKHMK